MIRASWKYLLVGAVVAGALWATAPQANAYWWGGGRTAWGCCYTPSYTSCYTPCRSYGCDDGGWYLGCRRGPVRRLLLGPYRWYRTDCGYRYGHGYRYGYGYRYGCGYNNCVTYGACCTSDTPTPPQPGQMPTPATRNPMTEPPAAMPTEPAPSPGMPGMQNDSDRLPTPNTSTTSADTSGVLTVWVPYDAKVTINGLVTRSKGSRRDFVSHGLKPGMSYKYVVHAQVVREGKVVEDTQTVTLTAGQIEAVAFGFNIQPTEQMASR